MNCKRVPRSHGDFPRSRSSRNSRATLFPPFLSWTGSSRTTVERDKLERRGSDRRFFVIVTRLYHLSSGQVEHVLIVLWCCPLRFPFIGPLSPSTGESSWPTRCPREKETDGWSGGWSGEEKRGEGRGPRRCLTRVRVCVLWWA